MGESASITRSLRQQIQLPGAMLVLMWAVALTDFYLATPLQHPLMQYGIEPRELAGLRGLLFAPFLHASWPHLLSNSLPFLILGGLVLLRGRQLFLTVTLGCMLLGGLGTWIIGSEGVHIGASGLVFGYFGFLLLRGWFERSLSAIALALLVAVIYGGLLFGVLPLEDGVSWESHLSGMISGGVLARVIRR